MVDLRSRGTQYKFERMMAPLLSHTQAVLALESLVQSPTLFCKLRLTISRMVPVFTPKFWPQILSVAQLILCPAMEVTYQKCLTLQQH